MSFIIYILSDLGLNFITLKSDLVASSVPKSTAPNSLWDSYHMSPWSTTVVTPDQSSLIPGKAGAPDLRSSVSF